MKVYSVISHVQYEGSDLLGVFGDVMSAMKCIESKEELKSYCDLGIVESELGEEIDVHSRIEWIYIYSF